MTEIQSDALRENDNCEKTSASFRIAGEGLNPDSITRRLGTEPSYCHSAGHTKTLRNGMVVRYRSGIWILDSEGKLSSTSLERHLLFLLGLIEEKSPEIVPFVASPSYRVDFLCCWMSATGHGGPVLSGSILKRLAPLCNEVNFDLYGIGDIQLG